MTDQEETNPKPEKFDLDTFPENLLIHERRTDRERRRRAGPTNTARVDQPALVPPQRRVKKERRRRIDPTTFEKQYTDDEIEFMNAMQQFKIQSGQTFPTYGEVLKVAAGLGYRKNDDGEPLD